MAALPERQARSSPCELRAFDPQFADQVVSWSQDAQEAYWLAPKTTPPVRTNDVLSWQVPEHEPFLMWAAGYSVPVGYGELNRLSRVRRRYWLGHLIVSPDRRGRGYGRELTRLLLEQAFLVHRAIEVTLVVFPENRSAIACYRSAGMVDDGFEMHSFPAYGRTERLLRMVIRRWPPPDYIK